MSKKGIIFDMDGTLWDSAEGVAIAWTQTIQEMYPERTGVTREDIMNVMGRTMDDIADALFGDLDLMERRILMDHCCGNENEYLRQNGGILYEGLEDTLQILKKDYPLFIVSNCQRGYIEAFLEFYGLEEYFEDTECFGNNGLPKGDNIAKIVRRNGLSDAVYVGDIQGDYEASQKAGIKFIHAAYGFGTISSPVPKIESLSELPQVVSGIFGCCDEEQL